MKPSQLFYLLGTIIAESCNCKAAWDIHDKTHQPIRDVSAEEKRTILEALRDTLEVVR